MGGPPTVLVTGADGRAALSLAAAFAVEAALTRENPTLLAEIGFEGRRRAATILAAPAAREAEARLKQLGFAASARGRRRRRRAAGRPAPRTGLARGARL